MVGVVLVIRALREEADCPRIVQVTQWLVLPLYVVTTVLASFPDLVSRLGPGLTALQVEAIIVAILLFFGVQSAWVMMIELADPADGGPSLGG